MAGFVCCWLARRKWLRVRLLAQSRARPWQEMACGKEGTGFYSCALPITPSAFRAFRMRKMPSNWGRAVALPVFYLLQKAAYQCRDVERGQ